MIPVPKSVVYSRSEKICQSEDLEEIDKWLKDRQTPEQAFAQEAATEDEKPTEEESKESEGP